MFTRKITCLSVLLATALMQACNNEAPPEAATATAPVAAAAPAVPGNAANVTGERLADADSEPGEWMSHGRTYGEQRFSPLDQINTTNVNQLGLAWYADLDTRRGQEATPLMEIGRAHV